MDDLEMLRSCIYRGRRRRSSSGVLRGSEAGGFAILAVCALIIVGGGLFVVNETVIPLNMAAEAMTHYSHDPDTFEDNLEHGSGGDFGTRYEDWSMSQGRSYSQTREVEEGLFRLVTF